MTKPLTAGEKIARDLCEMDAPMDNIIEVDPVDVARRIDEAIVFLLNQLSDCEFRNERLVANYAEVQEENNAIRRIHKNNIDSLDVQLTTLQSKSAALVDALETYFKQYPHMMKGYIVDALAAFKGER